MHFQIFIPGARGQNPQQLADVGLADLVGGAEFLESAGPGPAAVIVAWRRPGAVEMGYQPARQTWRPAIADGPLPAGRYWIGFWNDAPPTPEDLARPYRYKGTNVLLGDEQPWLIPQMEQLPRDFIQADDGSWKWEVQRRYHDLWLEAVQWVARFEGTARVAFTRAELLDYVVKIMRLNYRLTPEAITELRLLNTENVAAAFSAILGIPITLELT